MQPIETDWNAYFRQNGYPGSTPLGAGMEGTVYSLVPDQLIAKVWSFRTVPEVLRLQCFYEKLSSYSGPIITPSIRKVQAINGKAVSLERMLCGRPLEQCVSADADRAPVDSVHALETVLAFLRGIPIEPGFRELSVLDEGVPLWRDENRWSEAVQGILDRRMTRFGAQLETDVPDLAHMIAAIRAFLASRDNVPPALMHGDLCGHNIMVDETLKPHAVFDFGFLTGVGDPAFEVSISAGIFNMYGPHAAAIDDQLTHELASKFDHSVGTLLAYRAIYALITSNAYSPDGTDGHYWWCVRALRRADVRAALGL